MADTRLITIPSHYDARGWLYVTEAERDVPFAVRRVFWICDVPEQRVHRGGHAHLRCEQVLIVVHGGVMVTAGDFTNRPLRPDGMALYVPTNTRIDMFNWQPDTVLLVLCSEHYDATDYVYD